MDKEVFVEYFQELKIPDTLLKLFDFEKSCERKYFSEGFEFSIDKEKTGLRTYSDNAEFLNSIVEFANADASGSTYAFWLKDSLESSPIVAFGSEGGFHVIAESLLDLVRILTFDCEPMIDWDSAYFYKSEDSESSPMSTAYIDWVKEVFSIEPISNADDLVQKAQSTYQEQFRSWVSKYYND